MEDAQVQLGFAVEPETDEHGDSFLQIHDEPDWSLWDGGKVPSR